MVSRLTDLFQNCKTMFFFCFFSLLRKKSQQRSIATLDYYASMFLPKIFGRFGHQDKNILKTLYWHNCMPYCIRHLMSDRRADNLVSTTDFGVLTCYGEGKKILRHNQLSFHFPKITGWFYLIYSFLNSWPLG